MKIQACLIFICLAGYSVCAQSGHVPSIVALYPNEIAMDSASSAELRVYKNDSAVTEDFRKSFIRPGLEPNWKIIREKELAYLGQQDFFSMFALTVTREITYREVEHRSNLVIYPIKEKSNSALPAYKKVADQNKVSWVVNFTKAETKSEEGKRSLKVSVQLYNVVMPRLFVDKTFTLDSTQLKEDENCSETWHCLLIQTAHLIVNEIVDKVERNIRLAK